MMIGRWVSIAMLLVATSGCFERVLGTTTQAGGEGDASAGSPTADACVATALQPVLDASLSAAFPSNGVSLMDGIDPDHVTTLSGNCRLKAYNGEIECDGLAVRLNQPGISSGIGYERLDPVLPQCAGSNATAPPIAAFSFGTLEIAPGTVVGLEGERETAYAVALVAARSVRVHGRVRTYEGTGGFSYDESFIDFPTRGYGPSPGGLADGESPAGASGGGASTPGGIGGSAECGQAAQVPAQFEPMCGGSTGGFTGNDYGPDYEWVVYGSGGRGGGALQVSALESIEITGAGDCLVSADGWEGDAYERGGVGGGAGGTIILEAPSVVVDGDCRVTANGGRGADVQHDFGGGGGAGGTRDAPAQPGEDAPDPGVSDTKSYGGGGGGAAGFIRVRASSCGGDYSRFSPEVVCRVLP